ncbi:hypothetical protein ACIBEJ_51635 [Nonomuraea sp. NPDC050790]|uniref:hypothetical protein n=1 Tax=Nonomuraea sp. NPDC050790 TaxID=3364371 RepID=UPI0037BAE2E4
MLAVLPAFAGLALSPSPAQAAQPGYSCATLETEPSPQQRVFATGCTPLNGAPDNGLVREVFISWPGGRIQCFTARATRDGAYVRVSASPCA